MNVHASEWTPTFTGASTATEATGAAAAAWQLSPSTAAATVATTTTTTGAVLGASATYSANTSPSLTPTLSATRVSSTAQPHHLPPPLSQRSPYPEYYPTFFTGDDMSMRGAGAGGAEMLAPDGMNWADVYESMMELTEKMILQQEKEEGGGSGNHANRRGESTKGGGTSSLPTTPNPNSHASAKAGGAATTTTTKKSKRHGGTEPVTSNEPAGPPTWAEVLHPSKTNKQSSAAGKQGTPAKTTAVSSGNKKKSTTTTTTAPVRSTKQNAPQRGSMPAAAAFSSSEDGDMEDSDGVFDDDENQEFGRFGDWGEQQRQSVSRSRPYVPQDGKSMPPLTANGNHRWRKLTKGQRQRELAQKTAFESFAKALLHTTSPFTAPLRQRTKTSLPHIKVDQRFGKPGQPQSAIAQFVVAPLVTNYRPRHFHDVTPGDLLEYHYDFSHVLQALPTAYAVMIGYGPTWKRFAVPYAYVACQNYRQEVLSLCPHEVPNSRGDPIYEEDVLKDITDVVLAVEDLEALQHYSMRTAMRKRVNLSALYDVFDDVFRPLENYQIEIWHLDQKPSTFVLKANRAEVEGHRPIVLHGDPQLWDLLPEISRDELKAKCTVWQKHGGSSSGTGTGAVNNTTTTTTTTTTTSSSSGALAGTVTAMTPALPVGSHSSSISKGSPYHNSNATSHKKQYKKSSPGDGINDHDDDDESENGTGSRGRRGTAPQSMDMGMTVMIVAPILVSVVCVAAAVRVLMSMNRGK